MRDGSRYAHKAEREGCGSPEASVATSPVESSANDAMPRLRAAYVQVTLSIKQPPGSEGAKQRTQSPLMFSGGMPGWYVLLDCVSGHTPADRHTSRASSIGAPHRSQWVCVVHRPQQGHSADTGAGSVITAAATEAGSVITAAATAAAAAAAVTALSG
eukprot:7253145-Prymnesium_polylepis.4